jgi:hypothetical protein
MAHEFSWGISRISVELKTNVLGTSSVYIIRVDGDRASLQKLVSNSTLTHSGD